MDLSEIIFSTVVQIKVVYMPMVGREEMCADKQVAN